MAVDVDAAGGGGMRGESPLSCAVPLLGLGQNPRAAAVEGLRDMSPDDTSHSAASLPIPAY
jgi:hypothetical protein